MADQYISKYSNNKLVSAAQYITELICENKAKKDKADLHYRFWVNKKWAAFYRNQIASAHKLLAQYDDLAIVKALTSDSGRKIYSLRAPHLIDMIKLEETKLSQINNKLTIDTTRKENIKFQDNIKKCKNIVSKLKDIDNES